MSYAVRIIADSLSCWGPFRITSFEVTFPRIVLAELNTHCMLSRNSASSRAIPVAKRVSAVLEDPFTPKNPFVSDGTENQFDFVPEAFGTNQKGMQPGEALQGDDDLRARAIWLAARDHSAHAASALAGIGVHKQYANRLVEPYAWHTAVVTATELDNFFRQRVNPMAQGELCRAAEMMLEEREKSDPRVLSESEWHLPYVDPDEQFNLEVKGMSSEELQKVSVARCARVSYLTQNGVRDPLEDIRMHDDKLLAPGHMSPLEHVARPMSQFELNATRSYDISIDNGPMIRTGVGSYAHLGGDPRKGQSVILSPKGKIGHITDIRGPLHYCGKLNGFISRRAHVPGEWDIIEHRRRNYEERNTAE